MSRGQLGHGPQRYGADVMNVQLNFGKTGDKALRDSHAGQSPRLWPLQVEPYSACSRRPEGAHLSCPCHAPRSEVPHRGDTWEVEAERALRIKLLRSLSAFLVVAPWGAGQSLDVMF